LVLQASISERGVHMAPELPPLDEGIPPDEEVLLMPLDEELVLLPNPLLDDELDEELVLLPASFALPLDVAAPSFTAEASEGPSAALPTKLEHAANAMMLPVIISVICTCLFIGVSRAYCGARHSPVGRQHAPFMQAKPIGQLPHSISPHSIELKVPQNWFATWQVESLTSGGHEHTPTELQIFGAMQLLGQVIMPPQPSGSLPEHLDAHTTAAVKGVHMPELLLELLPLELPEGKPLEPPEEVEPLSVVPLDDELRPLDELVLPLDEDDVKELPSLDPSKGMIEFASEGIDPSGRSRSVVCPTKLEQAASNAMPLATVTAKYIGRVLTASHTCLGHCTFFRPYTNRNRLCPHTCRRPFRTRACHTHPLAISACNTCPHCRRRS
jgi:hypothetical protein